MAQTFEGKTLVSCKEVQPVEIVPLPPVSHHCTSASGMTVNGKGRELFHPPKGSTNTFWGSAGW